VCGRFACSRIPKVLGDTFGIPVPDDLPPRLNICPTQDISALIRSEGSGAVAFALLGWGLVPFWAKDKTIGPKLFNARSETAHEKPSFRAAFRHRRCLIPADGFYEWRKEGTRKHPYFITLTSQAPIVFAGLWETWTGQAGEILSSATILTTEANADIRPLHDRMPVILPEDAWAQWMDRSIQDLRKLQPLLLPLPEGKIQITQATI